jgi:flagellar motor protein MotB
MFCANGCTRGRPDFFSAQNTNPALANDPNTARLADANSRLSEFDSSNRDLHSQIAELQQQLNLSNEEKRLLRQQMGDAATQLRQMQTAKSDAEQQINILQASTQRRSGATIRSNSSLAQRIDAIRTTGVEVRQDGDVVRIELPTDRLFVQGTYQLQSSGTALLDQVATEIRKNYPRQLIGIEGHTDNLPIAGTVTTHHQIAATQSMTVFNYLSRSGYLPEKQMFTMAVGNNRPRFSNADPAGRSRNRRIEIVVYPEVFEGG